MTSKRASADPSKEAHGLYMVEKYERVIDYLYPLAQTIPRKHGTFRMVTDRMALYLWGLLHHADH